MKMKEDERIPARDNPPSIIVRESLNVDVRGTEDKGEESRREDRVAVAAVSPEFAIARQRMQAPTRHSLQLFIG